jgi:hypothetical protein
MNRYNPAIRRSHKQQKQKAKAKVPKKPGIMKRVKRFCFVVAVALFVLFAVGMFLETNAFFDSRGGKLAGWSIRSSSSLAYSACPEWLLVLFGLGLLYLWWKHKWLMSIIYGIVAGVVLGML